MITHQSCEGCAQKGGHVTYIFGLVENKIISALVERVSLNRAFFIRLVAILTSAAGNFPFDHGFGVGMLEPRCQW